MKVTMSFEFDSIEEMKVVTDKLAGVTPSNQDVEPAPVATATPKKKAAAPKPAAAEAAPVAEANNPFAGMKTVEKEAAPVATPAAETTAFDRAGFLSMVSSFITSKVQSGFAIAKVADIMGAMFFLPAGIPQCKLGELSDEQLVKFAQVFPSVKAAIDNASASSAGLV